MAKWHVFNMMAIFLFLDDNNWNPIEWDRAAEELTWERVCTGHRNCGTFLWCTLVMFFQRKDVYISREETKIAFYLDFCALDKENSLMLRWLAREVIFSIILDKLELLLGFSNRMRLSTRKPLSTL